MIKKYFIEENIQENDVSLFNSIVIKLDKLQINGAFFAGFPFSNIFKEICTIRGFIVCTKGIFVFYVEDDEMQRSKRIIYKIFMDSDKASLLLFNNNNSVEFVKIDGSNNFYSRIDNKPDLISLDLIKELISLIQDFTHLNSPDNRNISKDNSLGSKIRKRDEETSNLDSFQFDAIYKNNNTNLRVRGLAGSGKTVVLAKKMAFLHFQNPSLNLAYVFFTKSLKQTIDTFFKKFYSEMNKLHTEPDMEKIHIIHGWGNYQRPGLYSIMCEKMLQPNKPYSPGFDLEFVSGELVDNILGSFKQNEAQTFHYIFIDEAQDFGINFFKLAKLALMPSGKIVYAYDELQMLNDYIKQMPTPKEIFGKDEICVDLTLANCYRSPKEIIVVAHALGLGIYHRNIDNNIEFCNVIEDLSVWKAIGYKTVSGELNYGENVALSRDETIKNYAEESIVAYSKKLENQMQFIISEITRLVKEEDVLPEDILVVDLDALNLNYDYLYFCKLKNDYFKKHSLYKLDGEPIFNLNWLNRESSYAFKKINAVTFTTVYRAKGNEANIVFILNADKVVGNYMSYSRNKLFTAMTRAKFKVYVLGSGQNMESIIKEINEVKKNDYILNFKCPTKQEMKTYKNKICRETETIGQIEEMFYEYIKNRSDIDYEKFIDSIKIKFGNEAANEISIAIRKKPQKK